MMPMLASVRKTALHVLREEYDRLGRVHTNSAPRGGIPVGGGDWMDSFFRLEGVRGTLGALRRGIGLRRAIIDGKRVSEIAVKIWNGRREYQVHRWTKTVYHYLDVLERKIRSADSAMHC